MFHWRNFPFLFTCLLAGITQAQTPAEIQFSQSKGIHFIAYGDTRFTDPANTNAADPEVRRQLVRAIADAHPDFVTFGGDIAYNGDKPEDWKVYDQETAVWRERRIPVYPALGNHDLHGNVTVALRNYFARFPRLRHSRFYSVEGSNWMMLTLDSALDEVS